MMLTMQEPFLATSNPDQNKIKTKSLHGAIGGTFGGFIGGLTTVFFTSHFVEYLIHCIGGLLLGASLGALLGVIWAYQEQISKHGLFEQIELFMLNASIQVTIASLLHLAPHTTPVSFEASLICGAVGATTVTLISELNRRTNRILPQVVNSEEDCCMIGCYRL